MAQDELQKQTREVYRRLRTMHEPRVELDYGSAVELLVGTVLSAQCTDVKVNEVTGKLFRKYRTPEDYLKVSQEELEEDIRPTGFFRQKAKNIRGIMRALVDEHGGEVPADMGALTALPGIGRKSANVVLGNVHGVPGIVVDTHVGRVSRRLGLTEEEDPVKVEFALQELLPEKEWTEFGQVLVLHGRYICKARKPLCDECPLMDLCAHFRREVAPSRT